MSKKNKCPYCDGDGWIKRKGFKERCYMCNSIFDGHPFGWIKWFLLVILTAFIIKFCTGCSSSKSARQLKRAERLLQESIANGAKVDTFHIIKYDTTKIKGLRDSFRYTTEVSPEFVIKECDALQAAKGAKNRQKVLEKLQDVACPDIRVDTTYELSILNQGSTYNLPVHVTFTSKGNHTEHNIEVGALNLPQARQDNKIKISAGYTLWDMIILGLVVALVFLLVGKFLWK